MGVQSLGWEDTLEKKVATHYSGESLDRGAWRATVPWGCNKLGMTKAT